MKIVVIGNGMVGLRFCQKLVARFLPNSLELTVFAEEIRPAYDRVHLSEFFNGKSGDDLLLSPLSWYHQNNIALHLGDPVILIDRESKTVKSFKDLTIPYDYLVFATGSAGFVPNIDGVEKQGVFLYRTIEDLEMMHASAQHSRKASVLGGGLLGLEAAKALMDLGVPDINIIEFAPRLMPRQLDQAGSALLQKKLEELGLKIHLSKNTTRILGDSAINGIQFSDNTQLESDMLVISAGIRSRDELAHKIGLETDLRGGIRVNEKMVTSDPSIFAIGECASYNQMIYGLVAPGYEMADVAISSIAGEERLFTGFDMSTRLKLIGVDVASFGDSILPESDCNTVVYQDSVNKVYKRLNISKDGKYLLGGILVGNADDYNILLQTFRNKLVLPPNPEELLIRPVGGTRTSTLGGVSGLPNDAIICSCENVIKAAICRSVTEQECNTVDSIRNCTKAGSGCGGCVPMIKDLMLKTMKEQGKYVRVMLCEHFGYSRQELLDLIRHKKLHSYDQVLADLGKGDGCEVCKPVISSILASLWNEMILTKGNDTAQDSNDRYLANIQKGGTYSVVPRIPGGEITPDKLIVIGEVAKKYQLYTKITGGQRIDLFGAHLADLPDIWEALINAGFESGHAYGKALRTVKSCVGSTWCRFGLHDSVSYAIRIEERYRGLRAPHKIKSAVSGCVRECAEAQSKDFGIIATEKGWNLYVCGNGGSKPQHALLLATDLDSETCIRYIDRFLMFYINTADPLTRTATWLNKMEGGIEYLRNVIVNDSLGIAEQLESEMQLLVDNYKCEWKEAVENPQIRKRFTHFVNAPTEKDPSISFDTMREQKRAKEWK